jgi:hypothetical protein
MFSPFGVRGKTPGVFVKLIAQLSNLIRRRTAARIEIKVIHEILRRCAANQSFLFESV